MKKTTVLNRVFGRGAGSARPSAPALVSQARRPLSWLRTLTPPTPAGPSGKVATALVETKTASALLERIQAEVMEEVGPYGFQDGLCEDEEDCWICKHLRPAREYANMECEIPSPPAMRGPSVYCEISVAEPSSAALRAPQEGVDFSATNIQEAGVDEPDIVKTDGLRILAVGDGRLWYVDVTGKNPELRSSLELPYGRVREMFMSGGKVLLLISRENEDYFPWWDPAGRRRHSASGRDHYCGMAVLIDISNPERMDISETLQVSGEYVSARLVGKRATAVFVYHTPPLPEFVFPANESEKSLSRAAEFNRQVIRETTLADWVPSYIYERGEKVKEGLFIDCAFAYVPKTFSGRDMVSVLTVDMTGSLDPEAVTTVMTGEQDVHDSSRYIYASSRSLYVTAVQRPEKGAKNYSTNIHKFDIAGPDRARYVASGAVEGFMLNQFAMSEHDGYLRVATTNQPPESWWVEVEEEEESESRVDVLAHDGYRLRVVGSVGGLGRGEEIYAVRFLGKIGYVVTFRETDPLYTIDLSDPTAPRAAGELKILGYSSYLHPLEDGLLLGVGQDADEWGSISGTQVSVFDVSDLDNPRRTAQFTMEGASSEAEHDHRAFLYWAPERLAVLPVKNRRYQKDGIGALALEISKENVRQRELLRDHASIRRDPARPGNMVSLVMQMLRDHGSVRDSVLDEESYRLGRGYGLSLLRSLVVGDSLYTMSDGGLARYDLASLRETSWINFDSEMAAMERQAELAAS